MADTKNVCEEIEKAIYSDAELTEEQKMHIENCESCRVLLSQVSAMKSDLGALDVPGIPEGSIADSVMQKIKDEKSASSMPKFRFTHHLGSAAAIVIVLAAALILKNPSDPDPKKDGKAVDYNKAADIKIEASDSVQPIHEIHVAYSDEESDDIGLTTSDNSEENMILRAAPDSADTSTYEEESAEQENAPMLFSTAPPSDEATNNDSNGNSPEQPKLSFKYSSDSTNLNSSVPNQEAENSESAIEEQPSTGGGSSQPTAPSAGVPDVLQDNIQEESETYDNTGNDGAVLYESDENSVPEIESETAGSVGVTITGNSIFSGMTFLEGEENFEYNVDLANEKLSTLYNGEYRLSKTKLKNLGLNNSQLIGFASQATETKFNLYKNLLDIFE